MKEIIAKSRYKFVCRMENAQNSIRADESDLLSPFCNLCLTLLFSKVTRNIAIAQREIARAKLAIVKLNNIEIAKEISTIPDFTVSQCRFAMCNFRVCLIVTAKREKKFKYLTGQSKTLSFQFFTQLRVSR